MAKVVNQEISQDMIKNIEQYSDSIKTIENFMDAVRMRPGMYIGPRGAAGLLNMGREVWQNAIDQLVSKMSPCDMIWIVYDARDHSFIISDNGLGIPFDDMIRVYTKAHTSKNYEKQKGDYSAGLNGIGAKATNALSEVFKVTSYKYTGEAKEVVFKKGKLVSEKKVPNKEGRQGTTVEFKPDHSIMGETDLDTVTVYTLIRDMLSLTEIGNKIDYTSIAANGKTYHELIVNEDGILTNLIAKTGEPLITPIIVSRDTGEMKLDAAFTFDAKNIIGENITSFANMCPTSTTPQNTHVKGFLDGVCYWFTKYMNDTYLGDKSKIKVTPNDVKAGLSAMISAFHLNPDFTGQAKEVFSNSDYTAFAKNVMIEALNEWKKQKPNDLVKVAKFLKDVAQARINADKETIKVTAKYNKSSTSGLPEKYSKPTGPASLGWELFIVEGDSAKGSAASGRDPKRQGIFPIRGKILNVYDANLKAISNNVEIMSIADILGGGWGKNFDITKVKYQKIIFMPDADADGDHIASLLLLLFIKVFPGLIESGRVYKAVPPLYGKKNAKGKFEYFTERVDYAKYMQKEFIKNNMITDSTGKKISPSILTNMILEYDDYVDQFKSISDRFHVDKTLFEHLLIAHLKGYSFSKIQNMLVKENRFLKKENIVKEKDGSITIDGLVNQSINTVFMNDRFLRDCEPVLYYLRKAVAGNETEFVLNGKVVGLY
ncbi:MAG: ATP-binding protein, partial [Clostridia bacterium]|nr:ATP-binding protein [Clostridia bacterium]